MAPLPGRRLAHVAAPAAVPQNPRRVAFLAGLGVMGVLPQGCGAIADEPLSTSTSESHGLSCPTFSHGETSCSKARPW